LRLCRQFAVQQEVSDFEITTLLREFFDRIAAYSRMPLSPSMKVIRLLQDAVFMNAGS
jgi:hypothetical protein